jgi:lipoprotein-anchoring transpeptidase ErfK/SrfK
MIFRNKIENSNFGQEKGLSQKNMFFRKRYILFFALILISIGTGSAFIPIISSLSSKSVINESLGDTKPTSTPPTSPSSSISKQSPASNVRTPPAVKSDLDYISYRYHSWDIPDETSVGSGFWLEVDLTNQMLYAYQDDQLISGFKISSGTRSNETVTGTFKIYSKYPAIKMTGPGYDLPDVPYSMFFYKSFAIHGTYWHHNFGTPMSHGCVNMNTSDAAWIYTRAPVGTYVMVHY